MKLYRFYESFTKFNNHDTCIIYNFEFEFIQDSLLVWWYLQEEYVQCLALQLAIMIVVPKDFRKVDNALLIFRRRLVVVFTNEFYCFIAI